MMVQSPKTKPDAPGAGGNFSAMADKLGVTVPAAWPSGMAQLSDAYAACQRCVADKACADWLARMPDSIQLPPEFCPNHAEFARMNGTKSRS